MRNGNKWKIGRDGKGEKEKSGKEDQYEKHTKTEKFEFLWIIPLLENEMI